MASTSINPSISPILISAFEEDVDRLKGFENIYDVKDSHGRNALHYAAFGGITENCRYLSVEHQMDLNAKDDKGQTPLHLSTLGRHYAATKFLLERGADPNLLNARGHSALHYATEKGDVKLMEILIEKDAIVDANPDCGTPLCWAVAHNKVAAVKFLLEHGATPNMSSPRVFTPVITSILSSAFECTQLLLDAGAQPGEKSLEVAPIGLAAAEGLMEVIKLLVHHGADPNEPNYYGLTPIEVCALQGNHAGVKLLFPMSKRIPEISNWTCPGILQHVQSKIAQQKIEDALRNSFVLSQNAAKEAQDKGDYFNAIYWHTLVLKADPLQGDTLLKRSFCWEQLKDGEQALADAEACLTLNHKLAEAHQKKAAALMLLKRYPDAVDAFLEALHIDPENETLAEQLKSATDFMREETLASGLARRRSG